MNNRIFYVFVLILIGCDAHMQKGLEVYKERYTEPVTATHVNTGEFFMAEDNVDTAFTSRDFQPIKRKEEAKEQTILKTVTKAEVITEAGSIKVVFHGEGILGEYKVKNTENHEIVLVVKNVLPEGIPHDLSVDSDKLKRVKIARDATKKHLVVIFEFFSDVPLPELKVKKEPRGFSVHF